MSEAFDIDALGEEQNDNLKGGSNVGLPCISVLSVPYRKPYFQHDVYFCVSLIWYHFTSPDLRAVEPMDMVVESLGSAEAKLVVNASDNEDMSEDESDLEDEISDLENEITEPEQPNVVSNSIS